VILAIETSCDDTCAALLSIDGALRSSIRSSQAELHERFGGVVPEVASRRHLELVEPVVREALREADASLDDVTLVAATQGPGLIGALLVGLTAARAIAYARDLPFAPVDHLHGHVAAVALAPEPAEPPFCCLLASGGHSLLLDVPAHGRLDVLGGTLDDAAGEAFDKGARLLGLPHPGGPALEELARGGDPHAFRFPRPLAGRPGCDLSFSGLKTALMLRVRDIADDLPQHRADLAASYQCAIVDSLCDRAMRAVAASGRDVFSVVGGVAANGALRTALTDACAARGVRLALVPPALCVDNAAMIALAARHVEPLAPADYLSLDAYARSPLLSGRAIA